MGIQAAATAVVLPAAILSCCAHPTCSCRCQASGAAVRKPAVLRMHLHARHRRLLPLRRRHQAGQLDKLCRVHRAVAPPQLVVAATATMTLTAAVRIGRMKPQPAPSMTSGHSFTVQPQLQRAAACGGQHARRGAQWEAAAVHRALQQQHQQQSGSRPSAWLILQHSQGSWKRWVLLALLPRRHCRCTGAVSALLRQQAWPAGALAHLMVALLCDVRPPASLVSSRLRLHLAGNLAAPS